MHEIRFDGGSLIRAERLVGDPTMISVGPNVTVLCEELIIDGAVRLGTLEDDGFREPSGSQVRSKRLRLGDGSSIGRGVLLDCGSVWLGGGVRIGHRSTVRVKDWLILGSGTILHDRCEVAGRKIRIGRKGWILPEAKIGGGSCFEPHSQLDAGAWLHLGVRSLLNTARRVSLGREVGIGTGAALYTHGAYPSALDGKPFSYGPIEVGDRTWIPGAVVNPGVRIGADVVIGVGSVVNRDIPSGCLAGGVPARVLKEACFPKPLSAEAKLSFFNEFLGVFGELLSEIEPFEFETSPEMVSLEGKDTRVAYVRNAAALRTRSPRSPGRTIVICDGDHPALEPSRTTVIDLEAGEVRGEVCTYSEKTLDQLRRYGIRFDFEPLKGQYTAWRPEGPNWPS